MSEKNVESLTNIISWVLRVSPLFGVISLFFYIGGWAHGIESKSFDSAEQKREILQHIKRSDIHKTVEVEEAHFVTRREYEQSIAYIKEALIRIENQKN